MSLDANKNFIVCMTCIFGCFVLSVIVFFGSRNDPNLRIAALGFAQTIGGALVGTASTLLTGKDQRKDANPVIPDLPSSVSSAQTTVTTTATKE